MRREDPDVRLAGREHARTVGADQAHAGVPGLPVDAEHVVYGDALGDRDHRVHAGVDRLGDRRSGEPRRHEDHRGIGVALGDRLGDLVVHGNALHVLAALPRGDAGDHVGAVGPVSKPVEGPLPAGEAADHELRLLVYDDRHQPLAISTTRSAAPSIVFSK